MNHYPPTSWCHFQNTLQQLLPCLDVEVTGAFSGARFTPMTPSTHRQILRGHRSETLSGFFWLALVSVVVFPQGMGCSQEWEGSGAAV